MDTDQSHKTHKGRTVGNKAVKKDAVKKTKKGIDLEPNRGSNFKAFAGNSQGSRKAKSKVVAAERRENVMTLPSRDRTLRTLVQEPPLLVAVVGPPKCGKSTLIKSMVKFYTQRNIHHINGSITVVAGRARRVTFVECPNKLSAMCDLAKVCDLAIIMVDGAFGFELETFEFLSIAQTHGFPKVMGVISKLDMLRTNKQLKKTKRMLRHRFWHEVSAGAAVMCLSPMVRNAYRPSDVLKMHRTLVTIEPKMQNWRSSHSCVFVDRVEDVTAPAAVQADPGVNRSVAFYGYVRGKPINGVGDKFHVPGLGDVTVAALSRQSDPCEAAETVGATSQGSKMRTLGAKHKRCYAPYCNVGGVEFDEDGIFIAEDADLHEHVERHGAGLELMRELRENEEDAIGAGAARRKAVSGGGSSMLLPSSDAIKKEKIRVLGFGDDDDDDEYEDVDDDYEEEDQQQGDRRRKVRFANEDTLELVVPDVDSGSDDSSSDDDDDMDENKTDAALKKKKGGGKSSSRRVGQDDDDDDEDIYEYGNPLGDGDDDDDEGDDDDAVSAFANEAAMLNAGSLRPLRPFDRDTSRVLAGSSGIGSGVDWLEEKNRLSLKRLFVTGQSLGGGADGDEDDELGEMQQGADDDDGGDSDGGYESVNSDEVNDPEHFTSRAAGGGDDDDDDEEDFDIDDLDELDDLPSSSSRRRPVAAAAASSSSTAAAGIPDLSDDLQQYLDFFSAHDDNNSTGIGGKKKTAKLAGSAGAGGDGLMLDETDALVSAARGGAGGGGGFGGGDASDDIRPAGRGGAGASKGKKGRSNRPGTFGDDDDFGFFDDGDDGELADASAGGGGDDDDANNVDEDYIKKKMEKKKLFDEKYDNTTGKSNTTGFYQHLLEEEREKQRAITDTLDTVGEDIDKRVGIIGYFAGLYVRFVVHDVPCEFVQNFDPKQPIIAGGINPGEDRLEVVHTRFLRHRWYPRIQKAQDPITVSIGWRRIQVQPLYATEEAGGTGRWRYLKYTPKHMHCLAAFYGPVVPPNTGFIVIPTEERKAPHFRCLASGYTVGVDAATHVVKKLKITGVPEKIQKTTCFVKGMFNSDVEAAKFVGAKVKTVSGLRGSIKKVIKGKGGIVRCTFEDKLLKSDIIFVRTWKPVEVPRYCEVVPNLLMPAGSQWRGMRTMAQIRREDGIAPAFRPDSEYQEYDPRRQGRDLDAVLAGSKAAALNNPENAPPSMLVSRNTRMKLPFSLREEFVPLKTRSALQEEVRAETVVAPDPKELNRLALLHMFRDKADTMREKRAGTRGVKKAQKERAGAAEEERYKDKLKRAKKETARKVEFRSQHKSRGGGSGGGGGGGGGKRGGGKGK